MTSKPIRLLALSGSLRQTSANTALLRAAAILSPPGIDIVLFDRIDSLPHFNPDIEHDPPPAVAAWIGLLASADGLLIACPEYAHGVPGAFKNALDWVVSRAELGSKPVALINTSARAVHAHAALTEIVTTMHWQIVISPLIPVAGKQLQVADILADISLTTPLLAVIAAVSEKASV